MAEWPQCREMVSLGRSKWQSGLNREMVSLGRSKWQRGLNREVVS